MPKFNYNILRTTGPGKNTTIFIIPFDVYNVIRATRQPPLDSGFNPLPRVQVRDLTAKKDQTKWRQWIFHRLTECYFRRVSNIFGRLRRPGEGEKTKGVCKFPGKELGGGFSGAREETAFTGDFVENAHDFRSLKAARCRGYVIRIYDRRSALMLRACHNNGVITVIVVHRRRRSAPVVV